MKKKLLPTGISLSMHAIHREPLNYAQMHRQRQTWRGRGVKGEPVSPKNRWRPVDGSSKSLNRLFFTHELFHQYAFQRRLPSGQGHGDGTVAASGSSAASGRMQRHSEEIPATPG